MRRLPLLALLLSAAPPAFAQAVAPPAPTITVSGVGRVKTPPDRATISFELRGEGPTVRDSTLSIAAQQKALARGLGALGPQRLETSSVSLAEVRGRTCDSQGYRPRLSTGECAVEGSIAALSATLTLSDPSRAGTAVALLGSLGAVNARLTGFSLADTADAQRRAKQAAFANAQSTATGIVAAAGGKLGTLLAVRDGSGSGYDPYGIEEEPMAVPPPPPPPPPPAPVTLEVTPRPIETEARMSVTYAIER